MKTAYILAGALAATMGLTAMAADAKGRGGGERASFSELDADGSGEVTQAEILAHAQARFDAADMNGDGSLSAEEMIAARSDNASERLERRVSRFLERADDDGNGTLEFGEFGPSQERAAARFERIDTDGSGGISEAEMEAAKSARADRRGGDRGPRGGAETDEG
ncbi:MAG: calcium-binding protein [Pseudomonadota bacterium]